MPAAAAVSPSSATGSATATAGSICTTPTTTSTATRSPMGSATGARWRGSAPGAPPASGPAEAGELEARAERGVEAHPVEAGPEVGRSPDLRERLQEPWRGPGRRQRGVLKELDHDAVVGEPPGRRIAPVGAQERPDRLGQVP